MAICHTGLPETHPGERDLANLLVKLPDDALHLWFGLDSIPGVNDVDILVYHQERGVFVVEVKAVPMRMVERIGFNHCRIEGRSTDRSPTVQAQTAMHSLKNYLQKRTDVRLPFMVPSVCWPKIPRHQWNRSITDDRFRGDWAESMLFLEDVKGGPGVIADRLTRIRRTPPIGQGSEGRFRHDPKVLELLRAELDASCRPEPTRGDVEKITILENRARREARDDAPTDETTRIAYSGYPGTAKTFRLLEIALSHAAMGRRVLFTCFNKVLAADLKRLLAGIPQRADYAGLEITDIYDFATPIAEPYDIPRGDYEVWGQLLVEELQREAGGGQLGIYDAILIDEAQDLTDWMYELVRLHGKPESTIGIAVATGQELYGERGTWLPEFLKTAKRKNLRRNFRNTKPCFQFAQLVYESSLEIAKLPRAAKTVLKSSRKSRDQLLFEREDGAPPRLVYIDESGIDWTAQGSVTFTEGQRAAMAREYARLIREELGELDDLGHPQDLLVLVPSPKSCEADYARLALETEGIPCLDLTDDERRRDIPRRDQVRLCTFHSSRGLEAVRVLLFGFERIAKVAERAHAVPRNLAYIALSRSMFDVTLATRNKPGDEVLAFLQEARAVLDRRG